MGMASETTTAATPTVTAGAARPRRLYNPFPRPPAGLDFVRGHLHHDQSALTSRTLAAGKNFLVSWDSKSLAVHHRGQPERVLWATPSKGAFVAAALGESTIYESHGSFSVNDQTEFLLDHQTIEDITEGGQEGVQERACSDLKSVCFGSGVGDAVKVQLRDPDGTLLDDNGGAPVVVVTGCLYSTCELATWELWRYHNGNRREDHDSPFHETGIYDHIGSLTTLTLTT